MYDSSIEKLTFTGAQLKALCVDPSINTTETFEIATGLFGATTGQTAFVSTVMLMTTSAEPNSFGYISPNYGLGTNVTNDFSSSNSKQSAASDWLLEDGTLTTRFVAYSGVLADIDDSVSCDLYLTGGIVSE